MVFFMFFYLSRVFFAKRLDPKYIFKYYGDQLTI